MRLPRVTALRLAVVVALIAVILWLTNPFADVPDMSPGATNGAVLQAGGVMMSLRLPRGPYFLGELLPVDVALANHSRGALTLQGAATLSPCDSALGAITSGGGAPHFALTVFVEGISCPFGGMTTLVPGRTLTMHQFLALTDSGRVTVSAQASFLRVTHSSGGSTAITNGPSPFGRRWPALAITVQPRAPADRTLSLVHVGPVVAALAPLRVRPHLLYVYFVQCGGTGSGNFAWQPIPSGVVYDPGCPGNNEQWRVVIGAPGYVIAAADFAGRGGGRV